jgi:hypothetical protein
MSSTDDTERWAPKIDDSDYDSDGTEEPISPTDDGDLEIEGRWSKVVEGKVKERRKLPKSHRRTSWIGIFSLS